jgi:hypothetical protein
MKTQVILLISFLVMTSFTQSYEQAMLNAKERMDKASTINEFVEVANIFERIGQAEKTEWLPYYHAAYMYLLAGFDEQVLSKKDSWFDKAQQLLDQAFKIEPDESELFVLQAFIYPGRIVVDPMSRGLELLGNMNSALDRAIRLNPENPRSYYLRAITLLNMPVEFGGGAAVAKPVFETAREKFNSYKPKSSIYPDWGKEQNKEELEKL